MEMARASRIITSNASGAPRWVGGWPGSKSDVTNARQRQSHPPSRVWGPPTAHNGATPVACIRAPLPFPLPTAWGEGGQRPGEGIVSSVPVRESKRPGVGVEAISGTRPYQVQELKARQVVRAFSAASVPARTWPLSLHAAIGAQDIIMDGADRQHLLGVRIGDPVA